MKVSVPVCRCPCQRKHCQPFVLSQMGTILLGWNPHNVLSFISLSWGLLSEAIRKGVICALQGHRQGAKGKVFKMIFHPCCKISRKQRRTFPVAPGCRTSRRNPNRVVFWKRMSSNTIGITGKKYKRYFARRNNSR